MVTGNKLTILCPAMSVSQRLQILFSEVKLLMYWAISAIFRQFVSNSFFFLLYFYRICTELDKFHKGPNQY